MKTLQKKVPKGIIDLFNKETSSIRNPYFLNISN